MIEAEPAGLAAASGNAGEPPERAARADAPAASGPTRAGAKDARAERLAAALRTNLQRRKQARRNGLDDFGEAGGTPEEE